MFEVGRYLWRSLVQPIPSQAETCRASCPEVCPDDFWIPAKVETPQPFWPMRLWQWLVILIVRKCFLMFRGKLLCFSLCSLPLILSLDTSDKSLAPSSLHPPSRYLCTMARYPSKSFLLWLNSPSSPSLSSHLRCSSLWITFMALGSTLSSVSMSLLYWGAKNWTQDSRCGLTSAAQEEGSPPSSCQQSVVQWSQSYRWPSLGQGHIAALHSTCCSPGPPRFFPSKLLSSWVIPGIYSCMGDCSSPDMALHISPGSFSKKKILFFMITSESSGEQNRKKIQNQKTKLKSVLKLFNAHSFIFLVSKG